MSNNKIVRLPINWKQRMINQYGKGYVPCEVSNRWLQLPENCSDEKYMEVSVMTLDKEEKPKKICDLILSKEDIIRAVNNIKTK